METTKKPWESKTIWLNLLGVVGQFIPSVAEWTSTHADIVLAAFAVVNIILRAVTKDKISIQD